MMKKIIWIKTSNKKYYNLADKLNMIDVKIYEMKSDSDYIYIKTDKNSYDRILKYLVSYKFEIIKRSGIYRLYDIVRNYLLFFIMSVIGIILLLSLNKVVVDVDILHESNYLINLVEEELNYHGIKPLTFKKSYNEIEVIKQKILETYPDKIDWIEIEVIGMKYVVKLEERIIPSETKEEEYCNVYAKEDGVIKGISIVKGISVVSIGDYVKKGDLLISGDITYNEELKTEVCASGTIFAEKWYEVNVSVPFEYFEEVKTGVTRYNFSIEHENNSVNLLKDRIDNYQKEETMLFDLFGYKLYFQKQIEVNREYFKYTEEEAIDKAISLAISKFNVKLNGEESITEQNVLKKTTNSSKIEVDIFIVTKEVIS